MSVDVRGFAVADMQSREDAEHLQLPLDAHPFEVAPECAEVRSDGQLRGACTLPIADRPVQLLLLVPLDVRIAQQRHEVIRDRPVNGILEIQDARIRVSSPSGCANGSRGGRKRAAARGCSRAPIRTRARARVALRRVERDAEMPRDVPVRERDAARAAAARRRRRAACARATRAARGSARRSRRCTASAPTARPAPPRYVVVAEVGQQQEAAIEVGREYLRRVHARVDQQPGNVDERPAVLLARRGVHGDQRLRAAGAPRLRDASRGSSGGSSRRPMRARARTVGQTHASSRSQPDRCCVGACVGAVTMHARQPRARMREF